MIFNVKMEDFQRKARLVEGEHKTEVVTCETVNLALTIAALNNLTIKVCDVLNACITAPITDKVWTVLGPEFGPDAGKNALIERALWTEKCRCGVLRTTPCVVHATYGI